MKYNVARNDKYILKLKTELEKKYGLNIQQIEAGSRGVDGETWVIFLSRSRKVFAKIAYMQGHKERLKNSTIAVNYMIQRGITNINKILLTKDEQSYMEFNDGILCLFDFIDGDIDFNIPYERVLENLIEVYKIGDNDVILRENFEIESIIEKLKQLIDIESRKNDELGQLLKKHKEQLNVDMSILKKAQKLINKDGKKYITHGDACVNIIKGSHQDYLIDWDDALVAPIERDCWFFMNSREKIININKILLKNNIDYELSNEMLVFYAYKSYIIYLNDDIEKYIQTGNKDVLNDIEDLFDGWVRERMESIKI